MRDFRPTILPHPRYSDCPKRQAAMEEGIDAMTASIIDLVATVVHKRLTQFAELLADKHNPTAPKEGE